MSWCGCSNWDDRRQIQGFDAAALIQVWLSLLPFLYWQWLLTLYNWTTFWHIEHVYLGIGQNIHKEFFFSWECSYIMMLLCKCHCCLCCVRETIWSCWIEERSCFLHIEHNNSCGNRNICIFFSLQWQEVTIGGKWHNVPALAWARSGLIWVALCQCNPRHWALCIGTQDAGSLLWQLFPLQIFQTKYW